MTTGRINQISHLRAPLLPPEESTRAHSPRRGRSLIHGRDARGARPHRLPRRTRGDVDDHPIAPTKPLSAGPHAGIQPGRPFGGGGWLRHTALGWEGPDPVDNAGGRRIPRGGSLQESKCQVWPAAIRPQTPAVPGAPGAPDFGRRSGAQRVTKCDHGRHPPRASRARPERDAPNTVWRAAAGEAPADAERSCSRRSPRCWCRA